MTKEGIKNFMSLMQAMLDGKTIQRHFKPFDKKSNLLIKKL